MLTSSSLGFGASPCTQASSQFANGLARLHSRQLLASQHGTGYLELLWEIESNGVVLVSRFEVFTWLDESDDRRGHADFGIVYIVSRDVSEQSLQDQQQI